MAAVKGISVVRSTRIVPGPRPSLFWGCVVAPVLKKRGKGHTVIPLFPCRQNSDVNCAWVSIKTDASKPLGIRPATNVEVRPSSHLPLFAYINPPKKAGRRAAREVDSLQRWVESPHKHQ